MTQNSDLLKRREKALPRGIVTAFPFFVKEAKNSEVWDIENNRYIDFVGGISVLNTGHTHPKVTNAVIEQVKSFSHTAFQVAGYPAYVELAEKLNELAPGNTPKKTIFLSTGAEALENAVKIARSKTGRHGVITFVGGFHGRTLMTSAMTGKIEPYKKNISPFNAGVYHIPFPHEGLGVTEAQSLKALTYLFKADIEATDVAAIVIEPVQGEGGFYPVSKDFMQALRKICDENGICLVCDEVQTCFGRTGKFFATEHLDVEPDMITAAKSLAGGYPISAVIGKADVMDAAVPGGLGGTYAGSPVACAAALAVIDVIKEENLLERSNHVGKTLYDAIAKMKAETNVIGDIRHTGAMFAFDVVDSNNEPDPQKTKDIIKSAAEKGLMLLSCGFYGNTIRIMVPLTVSDELLHEGLEIIRQSL